MGKLISTLGIAMAPITGKFLFSNWAFITASVLRTQLNQSQTLFHEPYFLHISWFQLANGVRAAILLNHPTAYLIVKIKAKPMINSKTNKLLINQFFLFFSFGRIFSLLLMYQVYHNLFEKPIYFLWGIGKLAGP